MNKSSLSLIFVCLTAVFISTGNLIGGKPGIAFSAAALLIAIAGLISAILGAKEKKEGS